MIIGICGYDNSGKDTVTAYLMKEHGFERRAFADAGKQSIAAFFDLTQEQIERFKNDDTVYVTIGYKNEVVNEEANAVFPHIHSWSPIYEMTFREALRRYMTDAHRRVFSEEFWIDITLPVGGFYSGRKIAVSDVRFVSEADRIQELGGTLIKIYRPKLSTETLWQNLPYEIEQIEGDHTIINDGSIDELQAAVEEVLDLIQ